MYLHINTITSKEQAPFQPTWLYIKQHNVTGLKYFGKTTKKDPLRYPGSGVHWIRHIKKHGNDVSTIWCQLFTSKEELTACAIKFSEENNIVESKEWANLMLENGLDGNSYGNRHSVEARKKMSVSAKKPKSIIWKESASKLRKGSGNANYGKKMSENTLLLQKQNQPSTAGENNGRALLWQITSPAGETYSIFGTLKKFCKEHKLSASGMWTMANSGALPTKGKNIGWTITRLV